MGKLRQPRKKTAIILSSDDDDDDDNELAAWESCTSRARRLP
ncbi:hypothetical protein Vi05172_g146 [Venturia inaequalis]|nr:hypothetical protein Vi05172_g146 [Venturia inaequalis]